MTLGEARQTLQRFVENGTCSNQQIVTDYINEAISRLYAAGEFIGFVARYAVTIDQNVGEFTVPDGLESIMRVSEALEGQPGSPQGILIADDAQAFVMQSNSILPIRQIGPRKYRIFGYIPPVIDVMGKIKLVKITNNAATLPISDLPPLKNMCRAIWLEEAATGAAEFELSVASEQKAIAWMQTKTASEIEAARRTAFTQILTSSGQGTLGQARAHMSLYLTEGLRAEDSKIVELINAAHERILSSALYYEVGLFKTNRDMFSLPAHYDKILKININNLPTTLNSGWYSYQSGGVGYAERGDSLHHNVVALGEHALHTDLSQPTTLVVVSNGSEGVVDVTIKGINAQGEFVTELVTITSSQRVSTANVFAEIMAISKPTSNSSVSVIEPNGVEVAFMQYSDQNSFVSRYQLPNVCNEGAWLRVVARLKHKPRYHDREMLDVRNLDALSIMCQSVWAGRSGVEGSAEASILYGRQALSLIEKDRLLSKVGEQVRLEISPFPKRPKGLGR